MRTVCAFGLVLAPRSVGGAIWQVPTKALSLGCVLPALLLTACVAPSSYMGISLVAGAADPAVQSLAARAQRGDKQAQLDLGIRYEEGNGVPADLKRAQKLYRAAATTTGGTTFVYVPATKKGGRGYTMPVNMGPRVEGLAAAKRRASFFRQNDTGSRCPAIYGSTGPASASFMIQSVAPFSPSDPWHPPTAWFKYTQTNSRPYRQITWEWADVQTDRPYPNDPTSLTIYIETSSDEVNFKYFSQNSMKSRIEKSKILPGTYNKKYAVFRLLDEVDVLSATTHGTIEISYVKMGRLHREQMSVSPLTARQNLDVISQMYMGEQGSAERCYFSSSQPKITSEITPIR